jgi:hypothetical protein
MDAREVCPTVEEVLENQGMAGRKNIPAKITELLDSALELFENLAEPKGILQEWRITEFADIYDGKGWNDPEGPIIDIVPQAESLALFAATMGNSLIARSNELFAQGSAALGYMLDSVNNSGAERLGRLMGKKFLELLPNSSQGESRKVQYYSPGHCGWHISGQETIFAALHPEGIGVNLKSNWIMQPLKSISGILVVGDIEIHRFQPTFSFCIQCKERKCVPRFRLLEP